MPALLKHTHLQVGRFCLEENVQTKAARPPANLQKNVSAQPGKEIFKNAPRATKKKDKDNESNRQIRTS